MFFWLIYRIYLTKVGKWRHDSELGRVKAPGRDGKETIHPHCKYEKTDSVPEYFFMDNKYQVIPVPFLDDNFAYIVVHVESKQYVLVDPADFDTVQAALEHYELSPATNAPRAILTTHKHWDHAGHNDRFVAAYPGIKIIGGPGENTLAVTKEVQDNEVVTELLDGGISIKVIHTPCHTGHHVMFLATAGEDQFMFTGDCIFQSGVGMFFEGTAT